MSRRYTFHRAQQKISLGCALLLATFLLSACVAKHTSPGKDSELIARVWKDFTLHSFANKAQSCPYRLSASLRYTSKEKDGHRVLTYLWGNGGNSIWPLRLDVQAGIGVMAAMIKDERFGFLLYFPNESIAYEHWGLDKPHFLADMPLPFSIADLSLLLTGQYTSLFCDTDVLGGNSIPEAEVSPIGTVVYNLAETRLGGLLTLSPAGLPVGWQDMSGWNLTIDIRDTDEVVPGPRKLVFKHENGFQAIILVRERAKLDQPFTLEQLDLLLPPGTRVAPFETLQQ